MAVTDKGQVIRCPIGDVRETSRQAQGVYVFRVAEEENVVSVSLVGETSEEDAAEDETDETGVDQQIEGGETGESADDAPSGDADEGGEAPQ